MPDRTIPGLLRTVTLLVVGALLIGGCSRLELVYENADWLAARRIASFLELDRQQRLAVRDELQAYRAFHREERLPELEHFMAQTAALLANETPSDEAVQAGLTRAESLLRETLEDIIPLAARTLCGLTPGQIDQLEQTLADGRQNYVENIAPAGPSRMIERVESWTGELGTRQRVDLRRCEARRPDVLADWLTWREARDERFITLLQEDASQEAVETFLREWWLEDEARSPALQQARQQNRSITERCARTLLASLTPVQRDHAIARLEGYRGDISVIASR
jgi:hypothetical protein